MIAASKPLKNIEPLLGRGIYDVVEVARLVGRDPETVDRWARAKGLHPVRTKPLYTFLDLISLWVISELVKRGVPKNEIRSGVGYLSEVLGTQYPLAHHSLATVGAAVFGESGVDVGKRGQMALHSAIKDYLRPLDYGTDGLASVWRPARGVWINPRVQAGAPCIDGTRVPTALMAALVAQNEDPEDIADEFEVGLGQVRAALAFELAA